MFSNTAYEAMYQYIGLALHSKFIEIITSQKVFLGIVAMTFGILFLVTTIQFFSRYMPGSLMAQEYVPLSKYIKIVFLLMLGLSMLRLGSMTSVKRFNGESWHQNPYIHGQKRAVSPEYKVSFVFDIMSRTAEEISRFIARVVDDLFSSSNSQLDAPNFFFKAIMYGAANTIDDPNLKRGIHFYTEECFDRLLPMIGERNKEKALDGFFANNAGFDHKLSQLVIPTPDKTPYTCLDVKNELQSGLKTYAVAKTGGMGKGLDNHLKNNTGLNATSWENLQVSNFLINEFHSTHEAGLGIQKGSQIPTTGGRITQYLNRIVGADGLLSMFSGGSLQGAWVAATRAQEFSENLARAPHVAGFIKMILIAIFPWLMFFVVAGYWRVLFFWFLTYFSVLLWTPIWTLLYHIMVSIALSADVMESFGKLNDTVSLYGASLISSRIYHLFAVYSWLQLLTGTLFTGSLLYFLRPALNDTESDSTPKFINNTKDPVIAVGAKAAGAVGALL